MSVRRVALVADSDAWGGAEVYLTHLARRAHANGWAASVVAAEPVAARLRQAIAGHIAGHVAGHEVSVVRLSRHADQAPELRRALAAHRPEAVIVNLVDPASNRAAIEAAVSVAPTVGVLHLVGDLGPEAGQSALRGSYSRLAGALSPSREGRAQLTGELGMPPDAVAVIPNGVDVLAGPAPLPDHVPPLIGAVGRLTAQKGFDLLIAAARRLIAGGIPVELAIAGAGRDEAALRAAAAGLPVTFHGLLGDVRPFLRQLDLFCLPSRREALPFALLEAMAEARPCVATDVGDVAAAAAGAAVVVPAEDVDALSHALAGLVLDRDRRLDLAARARRRAIDRLGAAAMARRTFRFLDRKAVDDGGFALESSTG